MAIQDEIPKSRLTLRYKTEVNGQPEDITLPMRLLITGDFSQGSSNDRIVDLDERRIRNLDGTNTDQVMKDMGMSLSFTVENKIDGGEEEDLQISLPIDSIKSFSPDQVAQHVPKLKGLLALKTLIGEMLSNVDNRKELRKLMDELMSNPESLEKVLADLKGFESLKLPNAAETPIN
ncbi:MAG: type VI secretion system contractile sheath small subunit [Methylobacter sp.]|nr:type VI secretion system contractile sheath small subunit [Methylobacter sp.]MDP2099401.1 type VI secretion system contractile sheath small subunit [Methylobacter sp.]MDP2429906.1 type VI secretion system contractile sheath small subunit [Methylobacter sp.]MDP3053169.1 type VI secretion system contractile sheath small subunit [Methylobacter sp.]MDP3360554.1 type VI secretion system contractile sheath small subunit [Methylobacter sp.]